MNAYVHAPVLLSTYCILIVQISSQAEINQKMFLSFFLPHDSYNLSINKSTPFPVNILTKKVTKKPQKNN